MTDEQQPAESKRVHCHGQPALLWVCPPEQGGCGASGAIHNVEAIKHWSRGGLGQITCQCGAIVTIGRKADQPRILTPAQFAASQPRIVRGR